MERVDWAQRVKGCSMDWDRVDWSPVDWQRVNWCWVEGSRVGCRLVSWAWVSHTFVFDVSHVAAIPSNISVVVNDLNAAIRQGHPVVASHQGSIRGLVLAKVDTRVLVQNTVLKGVGLWWLSIAMNGFVNGHMVHRH